MLRIREMEDTEREGKRHEFVDEDLDVGGSFRSVQKWDFPFRGKREGRSAGDDSELNSPGWRLADSFDRELGNCLAAKFY